MTEIKDLKEGDFIRINGEVYEVKKIEKSPWKLTSQTTIFMCELTSIEYYTENLSDLSKIERNL